MKRDFVSFSQSYGVGDEVGAKLKYHTLLKEYLQLQKEFVSRKRKLHAAQQKRETIAAEVRFLRRKRKYLLKKQDLSVVKDAFHLPNSYIKSNALKVERNHSSPMEAVSEKFDHLRASDSHHGDEDGGRKDKILGQKPEKNIIYTRAVGKRKISWPDQVILKV